MSVNPKDAIGVKKAPLDLVPPAVMIAISDALADGAEKYGPQNWRENDGVKATIYYAAALRHLFAWVDGEDIAEDSGVHHLAHAAACLGILLDAQELGQMIDDRPTRGAAGAMLKARDKSKPTIGDYVSALAHDVAQIARFTATASEVSDGEAPSRESHTRYGNVRLSCCGAGAPRCVDCPYVEAVFAECCPGSCAACSAPPN